MQICSVSVRIRDSANHIVTNKEVTIPEIRVLQSLHGGKSSVTDIVPLRFERDFNHDDERQRLRQVYERGNGNGDEVHGMVAKLFTPHGRLPTTLKDIGYDPTLLAAEKRAQIERLQLEADELEGAPEPEHELTEAEIDAIEAQEAREAEEAAAEEKADPTPIKRGAKTKQPEGELM